MPKSPPTIRDHFVKEFKNTLMTVSEKVNAAKKNGDRFSISFDESTSVRNRRYMNFNLHNEQSFQSLGMIRVKCSMKSEKAIELIQGRLAKFNLNLDTDIVATITDGASAMMKVGRQTSPLHIVCLLHAIHLCICDILYKEKRKINEFNNKNNNAYDNEVEEDDSDLDETTEDNFDELPDIVLVSEFHKTVARVRKIVKMFRKSAGCHDDNLQPQNIASYGKEKALFLDCKTRWNSLLKMLQCFYELCKEIKVAMVQLEQEFEFSDDELKKINELCEARAPMEMAVDYFCKDKADLLLAENVIMFTLKKLRDLETKISKALQKIFQTRVQERRNPLKYLRFSNYLGEYRDHFGNKISKTKIAALAISFLKRLYPQSSYNHVEEDQENVEGELVTTESSGQPDQAPKIMTLSEEFVLFLDKKNHECEAISTQEESRSHIVKKETSLFEATNKRPENLEAVSRIAYNQAHISRARKGFFSHGTICHETEK